MDALPDCPYRLTTPRRGVFFCRHAMVRSAENLVDSDVCQLCGNRGTRCDAPRPIPREIARLNAPSQAAKVWSITKALASFVADGFTTVSREEYEWRLSICQECPQRDGNRCLKCGCNLKLKAQGRAFQCPLGKWSGDSLPPTAET